MTLTDSLQVDFLIVVISPAGSLEMNAHRHGLGEASTELSEGTVPGSVYWVRHAEPIGEGLFWELVPSFARPDQRRLQTLGIQDEVLHRNPSVGHTLYPEPMLPDQKFELDCQIVSRGHRPGYRSTPLIAPPKFREFNEISISSFGIADFTRGDGCNGDGVPLQAPGDR